MDIDDLVRDIARLGRLLAQVGGPDVTRTEAMLLGALSERPRRITELARLAGLTQPHVTTLVQGLEQQGLVSRAADPDDGRAVRIALSQEGAARVERRRRRIGEALVASLVAQGLDAEDVVAGTAERLRVVVLALEAAQSDSSSRTMPATGIETQSGRLLSS
jgi:DNA-binding MarR family transcriptional regulator